MRESSPIRRARVGVSAHFFVMGMIAGVWLARIPAVKAQAGLSDGALGVALFAVPVGLVLGAALAERLVDRAGSAIVARAAGIGSLLAAAGLTGALLSDSPGAVVAGFAVFGAGLSVVVPQVFAAGGRANPARPGSGLAKVVGLGYAGQAAGPAVIGAAASRVGLHIALAIPVLLALWIAAGAPAIASRAGAPRGEREPPSGAARRTGAKRRARSESNSGARQGAGGYGLTVSTWTTRRS